MGISTPLSLNVRDEYQTIAVIGDTHHPFQDRMTLALVERFLQEIQPQYLIYNGDIGDFYQVSKFAKDPRLMGTMQRDINSIDRMFERHNRIMPNTEKYLLDGTHEFRWIMFLQQNAAAVSVLDALTIPQLYKLEKHGIKYIPFEQGLLINRVFLILHSNIVSVHSAYTAKRLYEKHGGCGMCNHTHRGGSFYKRDRFGTWGWWENFCLCRLDPDWIQNPNWQQGFSLIHFTSHSRFWVEPIPIIDHKFLYGGRVYSNRREDAIHQEPS